MWYRTAQVGSPLLSLLSDPTLKYLGNFKEQFIELDKKIQESIKSLDPEQQQNFQNKLIDLRNDLSQNLNNNLNAQNRIATWNNLLEEIQNQKNNQDVLVIKDLRNIVDNRTSGSFVNDAYIDADKIFKEYLDAKTNLNIFSNLKSSSDVMEIANFFLQNSTDPKLSIIKNILNKVPIYKWNKVGEISDLLLNFYLKTKLEQGIKTEMEHTTDKDVAREIAMDHIYEDPNYYSKLKKLETEGTCGYDTDVATGAKLKTPGGLEEDGQKTSDKNMDDYKKQNNPSGKIKDPFGLSQFARELVMGLEEADPKTGTGKKPKGSSRRLYTDEDPSDTVGVKFSTKQDIIDTLSKTSFKSKSHARQSQIINLIHQRVRAAYERAKDPDVKRRLKTALDYAEQRKEASKDKTQRLKQLKEIGDASAQMFDYNKNQIKTAVNKIMQDVEREKSNEEFSFQEYPLTTFKSPNAEYDVFIGNTIFPWFYSIPENFRNLGDSKIIRDKLLRRIQIQIGFNINNNDKQTNFNEQFKVLSTVTNIAKELIKEIDKFNNILPAITIYAKVNEEDEILDPENPFDNSSTTSQRGKFYEKYIEKLLPNLPGNWVLKKNPMYFYLYNADKEKKYIEKFEKEFKNNLNEAKGSSIPYGSGYKKYIPEITKFMLDKGMNIKPLPVVKFIEDDEENAKNILGRTAFYNPNEKSISLFTLGRHPKDILRSFCHEMIHHMQNIEDRLPAFSTTNTQEDSTLNDIEEEAHKLGSMLMREFEDTIKK